MHACEKMKHEESNLCLVAGNNPLVNLSRRSPTLT